MTFLSSHVSTAKIGIDNKDAPPRVTGWAVHATVVEDDTKVEEKAVAAPSLTTRSVNRYETRELSINVFKTCLMPHWLRIICFIVRSEWWGMMETRRGSCASRFCVKIEFDYGSCEDEDEWSQSRSLTELQIKRAEMACLKREDSVRVTRCLQSTTMRYEINIHRQ